MYLGEPNICLHQLDVQETNVSIPQFYRVSNSSLDAGLRMDGPPALDLWDVVIEVLHSTKKTKRPIRLVPGNWCGTGNHSSNKTKHQNTNCKEQPRC